jgi:hypothetical protein
MKRNLLFVVERLAALLDENRLAVVARQHGIKKAKDSDSIGKLPDTPETGADSGLSGDAARICGLLWLGFGYLPICRKDCLLLNV